MQKNSQLLFMALLTIPCATYSMQPPRKKRKFEPPAKSAQATTRTVNTESLVAAASKPDAPVQDIFNYLKFLMTSPANTKEERDKQEKETSEMQARYAHIIAIEQKKIMETITQEQTKKAEARAKLNKSLSTLSCSKK